MSTIFLNKHQIWGDGARLRLNYYLPDYRVRSPILNDNHLVQWFRKPVNTDSTFECQRRIKIL